MSGTQFKSQVASSDYGPRRERGMALVIALILLTILTILGVASMSSVVMQERMAGNVNLQALAFQAASGGITQALDFGEDSSWVDSSGNTRTCEIGEDSDDEWQTDWYPDIVYRDGADDPDLPADIRVVFRHRLGCFLPNPIPVDWEDLDDYPMELLVLSQGEVQRFSGGAVQEVLSRREVEVKVSPGAGIGDCLFTVGPMAEGAFDGNIGKSSQFVVEGETPGGCPIQFASSGDAQEFRDILSGNAGSDRVGNWRPTPPGITHGGLRSPWNDPLLLARALNALKIGIRAWESWTDGYNVSGVTLPLTNPFAACEGELRPVANSKAPPTAPITYISGTLDLSGNDLAQGLVIIENSFESSGNVTYRSDLVVLGGSFNGKGLGGADSKGLIQIHNLATRYWDSPGNPNENRRRQPAYCTNEATCGAALPVMQLNTYFNIAGGGNATITAEDCAMIQARWQRINNCLDTLEGMVRNDDYEGLGISEFDLHRLHNNSIRVLNPGLSIPDFSDEPDSVRIDLPRCGGDAEAEGSVLTSWREYIDRERWE